MKQSPSFTATCATGLVFLAIALSPSTASAQIIKVWTRGAGPFNIDWNNANNWSLSGAPSTAGTEVLFSPFGNAPGLIVMPAGGSVELGNSTVQGGTYDFVGGTLFFRTGTLTNNGTTSIDSLQIKSGNILTVRGTGTTTINDLTSSDVIQGSLLVKGNVLWGGSMTNPTTVEVGVGGTLSLSGTYTNTASMLTNTGGVLRGRGDGTYFTSITDGVVFQDDITASPVAPSTTLFIGGPTSFDTIISQTAANAPAGIIYAGTLNLDLGLLSSALPDSAMLSLFLFDTLQKGGTFSSVNLTGNTSGPYAGLAFADLGSGVWQTGTTSGGQSFIFDENIGTLSVVAVPVPEPSTITIAGIGIGLAGWSAWKKRRLAEK